ncbi:DEAD/DEAH box helicase [Candidatus Bathyarchaeota archaeon]|nr:DEAD/DEAH box helicase [Candidatus Bathyarchaeota archaeon]
MGSNQSIFSLFSKPLREEIEKLGFETATDVQKKAIPLILNGENVLIISPTGTGKTEAACFPIFELYLRERTERPLHGISILYITPLRALNRDIFRRLMEIGGRLGINVQVRHGDTVSRIRRLQALHPPNMLITTPETLQAILPGKKMRIHLKEVRWVIVDEVHEVVSDKRGCQLSIGLERLRELTGREFQRIGLSATIGNPELVAKFLMGHSRVASVVKAEATKKLDVRIESPSPTSEDSRIADKILISAGSVGRIRRLFDLIDAHKSTLVFTNTREHAEALTSRIHALKPGLKAGVHHGSLSREVRIETERAFREGKLKAVICTSSLELGIDIGTVDFVVQYLSPRQVTKLVQRIGRSGHAIDAKPTGCVLAAWADDILEAGVIAKFAQNELLEMPQIHENALDALAHQIAGLALDFGKVGLDTVYQVITRAYPYRALTIEDLTSTVSQLERSGVIRFEEDMIKKRLPRTFRYYYENLSMIPDVKQYDVFDFMRRQKIGILDQEFIAKNGRPGVEFIMHGQCWRILNIDEEKRTLNVEPVAQSLGAIPSWEGEIIPVPFEIAKSVGQLRGVIAERLARNESPFDVLKGYLLERDAAEKVVETIRKHVEYSYPVPTDRRMVIECFENYVIIHACFGNLVNETLSRVLSAVLSSRLGINIASVSDPYRIAFIAPHYLDPEAVRRELMELTPDDVTMILDNILGDTAMFAWRLWHVAKRFGVIERRADYRMSRARMLVNALRDTPIYHETLRELKTEKLDIEGTKTIIELIRAGDIQVLIIKLKAEYSPLALPILDKIAPHDLLRPVIPTKALVDVIKERLSSERVRLVCIWNGDWTGIYHLRTLPERIRCPRCNSTLIATTYENDLELAKIAEKKVRGRKLTTEEEKKWQTAWKNASLIQTYGRRAAIAMAGRGIGPTTAVRILRKSYKTEEEFYMNILAAERNYLRTRMFWD